MKKILLLIFFTQILLGQTNQEIISWLNDFEDNNSPQRIMEGTFDDKVFLEYQTEGNLIINSMVYGPLSFYNSKIPIYKYKCKIKISDIIQIEAIESEKGNFIFYDIKICTKPSSDSMKILRMKDNESVFNEFLPQEYENYTERFGWCWSELRFKFQKEIAKNQLLRIYKSFTQLSKNHNINPKIGSYF